MLNVHIIPILSDNYAYALEAPNSQELVVIDPGEAAPIIAYLDAHGLKPTQIWHTHHHWDHVDGIEDLSAHYGGLPVFNTKNPPADHFAEEPLEIIKTPGHTLDHICFYFPKSAIIFTADTLFSMGCGRLFEGSATQMWESFSKISVLDDETLIYPGHEYTLSNAQFCLKQEPNNQALIERLEEVEKLRAENKPTIPVTLALEKQTNVFLRAKDAEEFAQLRALKDKG
ncbi:MAG: hydroxyacylglutathione hydrolase [Micavibrio sp.]|nr:hydroxyacylglutathione hydrolase [Micavibrio sp.]